MKLSKVLFAAATLIASMSAVATPVVLTFEGGGNDVSINNFYNGGTDSGGNSGVNYGVRFGSTSRSLIQKGSEGGTGNFANAPSGDTIMYYMKGSDVLNVDAGFTSGFSFYYSSSKAGSVTVWDELDGTGNQLGTVSLVIQNSVNCTGALYCHWTNASTSFAGTAHSINFSAVANGVGFDNITFGAVEAVPEPSTYALLALGLAGIGFVSRRKSA